MKAGWKVKRLGEVSDLVSTGPFGSLLHKRDYAATGVPVINPVDIVDGKIRHSTAKRVTDKTASRLSSYRMLPGDIVVARRGDLGRCATIADDQKGWLCGTGSFFVRPSSAVLPEYIARFIASPPARKLFDSASTGATMPNISNRTLADLPVPLPPLEEQRRIVAVLDEAFEGLSRARANAEANLLSGRELFKSALFDLYEVKLAKCKRASLSEVCDLISGQHIEAKDYNANGVGIGYLTGPSDFGEVNPVVTKWTEKPKRSAIAGDILITVKGSGVGSVNLMVDAELAISRQLMAIRSKGIEVDFLFGFVRMQQQHFQNQSNGAAIPGISRGDVLALKIPVPDADKQSQFAAYLSEVEVRSKAGQKNYKAKLRDLEALRQSLLQKAFAGELTVKEFA